MMRRILFFNYCQFLLLCWILFACSVTYQESKAIKEGKDPNFKIHVNTDLSFPLFNRKTEVFGIDVYAMAEVDDSKLLHVTNVLAQYLDNDEDGFPDNQTVLDCMVKSNACMIVWADEKGLRRLEPPEDRICQDVGNNETNPYFVRNGRKGDFDASLEEVLHLMTNAGYAKAYPKIFGEYSGSAFAKAMDTARGGHFKKIPRSYPQSAWYKYRDKTCSYDCQIAEYQYWVISSILGAQEFRSDEIHHEWILNTKELVMHNDSLAFEIVSDPIYKLPKILPDGSYRQ